MTPDARSVLDLLAQGKVTADEAERLLAALERPAPEAGPVGAQPPPRRYRYLRVVVDSDEEGRRGGKVNVRVPMQLLRAGVRFSSLMPERTRDEINAAIRRQGVDFDINQLRPENLEALIDQIGELSVDVASDRAKVRVFCE